MESLKHVFANMCLRSLQRIWRPGEFFDMVTHVFDNSNLSQEIFAIDTWRAIICSLGHGRKHMITILPTLSRPGLKSRQLLLTHSSRVKKNLQTNVLLISNRV